MNFNAQANLKQLQASDPQATVWVNANAGSGKTHVLVDRVIRLMLGGTDPSRIMCLTFTKAAAAEMTNRLFERLSTWIVIGDTQLTELLAKLGITSPDRAMLERARQLFTRALETPGGLKIQTIHAFCERLLQLFPVEAGIIPNFVTLEERQAKENLQAARDAVLGRAAADDTSDFGLALNDIASRVQAEAFDTLLTSMLAKRASLHGAFDGEDGLAATGTLLRHHLELAEGVTEDTVHAACTIDAARYGDLAAALENGTKTEIERASQLREILLNEAVSLLDLESILLTGKREARVNAANASTMRQFLWIEDFVKQEQRRLLEVLGMLGDLDCIAATLSALRLGAAIVSEYEAMKRRHGHYDFDDLIIKAGELLRERPDAAWVLYKLDGGIEHLLVDEAQDTSPAQWEIIRSLTDEFFAGEGRHGAKPRTLFVVGDRKQSIYSFQGADPGIFETVYDSYQDRVTSAGREFRGVDLTVSFRSAPEILDAVDRVFDRSSLARIGLDGERQRDWHHESNRRGDKGTVEVWDLVEPLEAPPQDHWQAPVDREPAHAPARRLARLLAKTIKSWTGQRWLAAQQRAVEAGDILILVRQRSNFFDAMIRALWSEGVPVAGADRLKLAENIAVLDLMALAQFCIMPEDDHALACILKSPLLETPVTEDGLLNVAAERQGTLWQSLTQRAEPVFVAASGQLAPLIAAAPAARPFEFFSGVLQAARLRFLGRLGSEANDAIDALLDLTLDYELQQGSSLAGFVNWFAGGEVQIKRNMEQAKGEVRIMTVHGAKGLESPIVILPDTTASAESKPVTLLFLKAGSGDARVPLWLAPKSFVSPRLQALKDARKNEQTAEHQRLLYVAMTRAQDELYVCGSVGTREQPKHCWYNTVRAALESDPAREVISEPPGFRLGAPPSFAAASGVPPVGAAPLPGWVSQPVGWVSGDRHPTEPKPPKRDPALARQGVLIHHILQQLPELEPRNWDSFIAQKIARAGAAPELAAELSGVIALPAFTELMSPDGVSEVSLQVETTGGPAQRRRIDRLVPTSHGFLVADYKTDREVPGSIEACNPDYILQMAGYRDALRKIHPGQPLRMALLWTAAPYLMDIPDWVMDGMADQLSVSRP